MATAGSIRIGVSAGVTDFKKDMGEARGILASFTATMSGGSRITFDFFNGINMVSGAVRSLVGVVGDVIMTSADQAEAMDLVRIMYGDSANVVIAKSEEMAAKYGTVKAEFLSGVGTLEGLLGAMGGTGKETAELANRFGSLAVDMESAFNSDFALELERIRAGLSGEAEPLRRYGVDLLEATVKQEAYRSGIAKIGEELTTAQKIQARSNIIFNDLNKVIGNKELTSGSTANKVKELGGRFENLRADVGGAVEIIGNSFFVVLGEGLIQASGGFDNLTGSIREWSAESLRFGGVFNETFGTVGMGIASVIDGATFGFDVLKGYVITVGNLFTSFAVTLIDIGLTVGSLYEMASGQEVAFLDSAQGFRDALIDRNEELLAQRDNLFQGTKATDELRSFIESSQSRLDALGNAIPTTIATGVEDAGLKAGENIADAISSKVELASALDFGSADALSAINRSRIGGGKDTGVEVAKDQLGVQRNLLAEMKTFTQAFFSTSNETLDI